MAREKLLIYGASGHAKVVLDIVELSGDYEIVGLLDDNPRLHGRQLSGYPILGGFELLSSKDHRDCKLILAVGDNRARRELCRRVRALGYELACAVHPSAQIARGVSVGGGTVIMANAAINPGTEVGENVIINTGATIDHDCVIEDYVHISPGVHLAGEVNVGELAHIGIGASVIQGVRIGRNSIIGAGAVVIDDIPEGVTVVGIPAEVIKRHEG